MLSMVEVKCPHCQVRGQIMLPPLGAIIVGPCPNCDELVVVFCGRVLPLNKETIVHGTPEEKHEHLKRVLVDFIDDRIKKVVDQLTPDVTEGLHDYTPEHDDYQPPLNEDGTLQNLPDLPVNKPRQISLEESQQFASANGELSKIDDPRFFKKFFGK